MFPLRMQSDFPLVVRGVQSHAIASWFLVTALCLVWIVVAAPGAMAQDNSGTRPNGSPKIETKEDVERTSATDRSAERESGSAKTGSKRSASRSVVSMLLSFTFVDNLLEAATRSPHRLPEYAKVDPAISEAFSQASLRKNREDASVPSASSNGNQSKDGQLEAAGEDEATPSGVNAARDDEESSVAPVDEASGTLSSIGAASDVASPSESGMESVVERPESQQRAVRSVRMLVVALGVIAIVGLLRLLMHLNQLAHGNYAGRLQFIGWIGVTVILVLSLGVALNEDLWQLSEEPPTVAEELVTDTAN